MSNSTSTPPTNPPATKPAAIITCLYPRLANLTFNLPYYLTSHLPLTTQLWSPHGLLNTTVCELTPDSEHAYMVVLEFKDLAGWDAAQNDGESKRLVDDVGNFTNSRPRFVVGRVV